MLVVSWGPRSTATMMLSATRPRPLGVRLAAGDYPHAGGSRCCLPSALIRDGTLKTPAAGAVLKVLTAYLIRCHIPHRPKLRRWHADPGKTAHFQRAPSTPSDIHIRDPENIRPRPIVLPRRIRRHGPALASWPATVRRHVLVTTFHRHHAGNDSLLWFAFPAARNHPPTTIGRTPKVHTAPGGSQPPPLVQAA